MNWNEMSPRERDALVATEVMGWTLVQHTWPDGVREAWYEGTAHDRAGRYYGVDLWSPTTSISSAWEVVEKMGSERYVMDMNHDCYERGESAGTTVRFWKLPDRGDLMYDGHYLMYDGHHAESAPEAICLAALRAKGVDA